MTLRKLYQSDQHQWSSLQTQQFSPLENTVPNRRGFQSFYEKRAKLEDNFHLGHTSKMQSRPEIIDSIQISSPEKMKKEKSKTAFEEIEMKFSFNRDWHVGQTTNRSIETEKSKEEERLRLQESNNNQREPKESQVTEIPLSLESERKDSELCQFKEIHNILGNRRRQHSAGVIKKNKKVSQIENKILHEQFFNTDIDLQELENIRMSKLCEMNEKLNRVLTKQNLKEIAAKRCEYKSHQSEQKKQVQMRQRYTCLSSINKQNNMASAFDISKNFVKKQVKILQQRQNLAKVIEKLFEKLDNNKLGKLSKGNCRSEDIPEELKFIFGGIFTKIFLQQLICDQRQFVRLCLDALKQLDCKEILVLFKKMFPEENRCLSSYDKKNNFQIIQAESFFNSFESGQRNFYHKDSRNTGEEFQDNEFDKKIKEIDKKYEKKAFEPNIEFRQNIFYSNSKSKQEELPRKNCQSFASQRRRSVNITQSMIKQQRKSLRQLNTLDEMVSKCLNSKCEVQRNGSRFEEDTLHFDELIQHI